MWIAVSPAFRAAFPGGIFGVLTVSGCPNRPTAAALQSDMRAVEARLRERFPGEAIHHDPIARAYAGYFRRHGGRYPVVHQARTVLQGRAIESPSALVEVMFTAELDSLVLTSGHDLAALRGPLAVDAAPSGEVYTKLSGMAQEVRAGDMVLRDAEGIVACVVHGPDFRTRLRPETSAALYGAWCPTDVAVTAVEGHLGMLARLLHTEWPGAAIEEPRILRAADAGA